VTETVYEITLTPRRGDGYLTEQDVAEALLGVPLAGSVSVRVEECDDFAGSAPGYLARHLSGSTLHDDALVFRQSAFSIGREFTRMFDIAASAYLTVEAGSLGA
jgi:hypothetical protein